MDFLIKKDIDSSFFELIIDVNIFSKDLILRTAYNFLDKGYFLFSMDWKNIKLQCKKKEDCQDDTEKIILDFSDELLNVYLRVKIEQENKSLRETIINTALSSSIDLSNYVEIETNTNNFDDEIENILKDLENDPELKIDEEDIRKLLSEVRWEDTHLVKPINLNINNLLDAKKKFQNR